MITFGTGIKILMKNTTKELKKLMKIKKELEEKEKEDYPSHN